MRDPNVLRPQADSAVVLSASEDFPGLGVAEPDHLAGHRFGGFRVEVEFGGAWRTPPLARIIDTFSVTR